MVARAGQPPAPYVESPEKAAARAENEALAPKQRAARVREMCGPQACDESEARAIASTCKTSPECAALLAIIAAGAKAKGERARVEYAESYEAGLLQRRMNPDGVSATGAEKRTLTVRGWFCSRQFFFDVMNSPTRGEMTAVGFKHLTCQGVQTWEQDL